MLPRDEDFEGNCTLVIPSTPTPPVTTAESPTTGLTPSTTRTTPAAGTGVRVPFWAYIIIGVGGLLLLVVLFGTPLAIFLYRNYKQKKHWNEVLKVTGEHF